MKLLYTSTSPYVRKVRVVILEKGLQDQVEEIISLPADKKPELIAANPLGKVPALMLDDGTALYDSPVICEYLDSLVEQPRLLPADEQRWPVLKAQALADGVLDVAVATVMERRRDSAEQSPGAIQHWQNQMLSAVKVMSAQLALLGQAVNLGHIALTVALGYLDFRHDDLQWRNHAEPALIDWYSEFSQRSAIQQTEPPA